jgi:gamma-glutamylcyclotransferase (GGCT)/AIG2-like uncharacterized protein YtfP
MAMSAYLFVYGTLLPERAPYGVADAVRRLRYVGRASAQGRLYDLGEYPGAVLDAASRMKIMGRVFELPEGKDVLKSLDEYEGFDPQDKESSLFAREQAKIKLEDGPSLLCWVYVYNQDVGQAKLISDGDYLKYQAA